ncbi:MAG: hypothetical protein Q4B29_01025 [Candidatus Saccharibacteria bacterium]|nr:hypothetical protein [Candidatus Saccharibacteria bacterium]
MFKAFCFIFLYILTWIAYYPEPLSASDSVQVRGLDDSNIVQTVIKPEPVEETPVISPAKTASTPKPKPQSTSTPTPAKPTNSINIGGRQINLVHVNSTTVDAGNHANKVNKLVYGHNSAAVFGHLRSLQIGQTFTITENGITTTYKISFIDTYEKNGDLLQKNGTKSYMNSVYNAKDVNRTEHDLAIMTCAGTSLGNGDATHRLVIFADAI